MDVSQRYWSLVQSLVDRAITTRDLWRVIDPGQYAQVLKSKEYGFKIKNILCDVAKTMAWTKCAMDYMKSSDAVFDTTNPIFQVCLANNIDPIKLASYIAKWASAHNEGKVRNVFWITGSTSTGARLLFDAIASSVPLVKYADWMTPENPFWRCTKSLMIVWDDGRISQSQLPVIMPVFRGDYICRGAPPPYRKFEMFCTPVLLWGDPDDIFYVHSSECVSTDHVDDFKAMCTRLHLTAPLPPCVSNFTVRDVHAFVRWGLGTNDCDVADIDMFKPCFISQ